MGGGGVREMSSTELGEKRGWLNISLSEVPHSKFPLPGLNAIDPWDLFESKQDSTVKLKCHAYV